jgi:hypothetical protein
MTQGTPTDSFVGFVTALDPQQNNPKEQMRHVFTSARYSDLSGDVSSLPDALARAIAASDAETMTQIAEVVGDLAGDYEGYLKLR